MSTRKFSVGDRVRVIANPVNPAMVGTETVITGGPEIFFSPDGFPEPAWEIDLPTSHPAQAYSHPRAWLPPWALEPLYDGNQAASWSECVWQPRALKV